MPQIFKGSFSSKFKKIWAQIRQGAFDYKERVDDALFIYSFFPVSCFCLLNRFTLFSREMNL
jgi:hypothetical protein